MADYYAKYADPFLVPFNGKKSNKTGISIQYICV
jgi:hypothetical protein